MLLVGEKLHCIANNNYYIPESDKIVKPSGAHVLLNTRQHQSHSRMVAIFSPYSRFSATPTSRPTQRDPIM